MAYNANAHRQPQATISHAVSGAAITPPTDMKPPSEPAAKPCPVRGIQREITPMHPGTKPAWATPIAMRMITMIP